MDMYLTCLGNVMFVQTVCMYVCILVCMMVCIFDNIGGVCHAGVTGDR